MKLEFDIAQTAFSYFGSYLSIMIPGASPMIGSPAPLGPGIYLRIHRCATAQRNVFLLGLLDDHGQPGKTVASATPEALTLTGPCGLVSLCFSGTETLRVRGKGPRLRLQIPARPGVIAHPAGENRWVVNARPSLARFLFEPMHGGVHVGETINPAGTKVINVELVPDAHGHFDAAIDVFQSTWIPRVRSPFEECVAGVEGEFHRWLDTMPPAPASLAMARVAAAYTNWAAVVEPDGFFRRPAMLMSKGWMDQVWSWDNCFNAMALCGGNPQLAWDQLWLMIDHQDDFGAFPDALNPLFRHYNFSKPPVLGWALGWMMAETPGFFCENRLQEIYEPLGRWTRWWLEHRTAPGETLPHYLHGNDSGWDNSTMFDAGAPLIAPDLAALLILQLETLGDLADALGKPREAAWWRERAAAMLEALLQELWRADHFIARRQHDGFEVHCESLIPIVPIVLGQRLPADVLAALIRQIPEFLTEHGLATEKPSSPHYATSGYWRGPIWAPSTLLIVDGLRCCGEQALAEDIASRFCAMCAGSGFAENFDALSGRGLCDTGYTWTSSVFLLLAGIRKN